jgi:hypothetical protein
VIRRNYVTGFKLFRGEKLGNGSTVPSKVKD